MHAWQHFHRPLCLVLLVAAALTGPVLSGEEGQVLVFPAPPHADAIGTQVGAIDTRIDRVTLSPPASVHRAGLEYLEIRGMISGVGWGGQPVAMRCHYTYSLPYVLRIPAAWRGGLLTFRHGSAPLDVWEALEAAAGELSVGRIFHEGADRVLSDVALDPRRRWAFFAVNYVGVAPGGAHNTLLVGGEPGCPEGAPSQGIQDATITRDHAVLARHLLKRLRGREPSITIGAGHSAGTATHLILNAGIDHRRTGTVQVGDNHLVPYDPASGRIFDGFLSLQGGFAGASIPAALLGGLSAPTIFINAEADRGTPGAITTINEMALNPAINVQGLTRLYTVLNMPHIDADLVLSSNRPGTVFADPAAPEYFKGGGDRLKPLASALLEALARWITEGIAPPQSIFNGEVKTGPDRIEFRRTSPPATSVPYVDDLSIDTYIQPPPIVPNAALRTAWTRVRTSLGATIGSIVLPETQCRRAGFHFSGMGPVGTKVTPFDDVTFLARWGSSAAYQSCRVQTAETLSAAGFYDETEVTIDVNPDAFPNIVSAGQGGRLRVAILSTSGFDATDIVPGSLRLASATMFGAASNPGGTHAQDADVNGDGRTDLLVEFRMDRLNLNPDDIIVDVWGRTRGGKAFTGTDLVQIVP